MNSDASRLPGFPASARLPGFPAPRRPKPNHTDRIMVDVSFTLLAMYAALLAMVLQASKVAEAEAKSKDSSSTAQVSAGDIAVTAKWKDGADVDVDLWVRAPGDEEPVGYSRRADKQSSYVRDDVGLLNDPGPANFETTFIRGKTPGIYTVNVHLYNARDQSQVPVTVELVATQISPPREIASAAVTLKEIGEEDTAFSFEVGQDGNIVPGSMTNRYVPLRNIPEGAR